MSFDTSRFYTAICTRLLCLPLLLLACHAAAAQTPQPPGLDHPPRPDMAMGGPPDGGHGPGHGLGPGMGRLPGGGPLGELAMAEADEVASQAIAGLANAKLVDVQRTVRSWGVPTALRYYDLSPKAFHTAVLPGLVDVVQAAAKDRRISDTQAQRIVERLQQEPPPMPPMPE